MFFKNLNDLNSFLTKRKGEVSAKLDKLTKELKMWTQMREIPPRLVKYCIGQKELDGVISETLKTGKADPKEINKNVIQPLSNILQKFNESNDSTERTSEETHEKVFFTEKTQGYRREQEQQEDSNSMKKRELKALDKELSSSLFPNYEFNNFETPNKDYFSPSPQPMNYDDRRFYDYEQPSYGMYPGYGNMQGNLMNPSYYGEGIGQNSMMYPNDTSFFENPNLGPDQKVGEIMKSPEIPFSRNINEDKNTNCAGVYQNDEDNFFGKPDIADNFKDAYNDPGLYGESSQKVDQINNFDRGSNDNQPSMFNDNKGLLDGDIPEHRVDNGESLMIDNPMNPEGTTGQDTQFDNGNIQNQGMYMNYPNTMGASMYGTQQPQMMDQYMGDNAYQGNMYDMQGVNGNCYNYPYIKAEGSEMLNYDNYTGQHLNPHAYTKDERKVEKGPKTGKKRNKYKMLPTELKRRAVQLATSQGNVKAAAKYYQVPLKSLKRWMKVGCERKKGGGRKTKDPEMEKELYQWYLEMKRNHQPVTAKMIKEKAIKLTHCEDFIASKGWLDKFKVRFNLDITKESSKDHNKRPRNHEQSIAQRNRSKSEFPNVRPTVNMKNEPFSIRRSVSKSIKHEHNYENDNYKIKEEHNNIQVLPETRIWSQTNTNIKEEQKEGISFGNLSNDLPFNAHTNVNIDENEVNDLGNNKISIPLCESICSPGGLITSNK